MDATFFQSACGNSNINPQKWQIPNLSWAAGEVWFSLLLFPASTRVSCRHPFIWTSPLAQQVKIATFDVSVPGMGDIMVQRTNFKLNQWQTFIVFGRQLVSVDFNNIPRCVSFEYSPFFCLPNLILLSALRSWRFALLDHSIDVYLSPMTDCSLVCIKYVRKMQLAPNPALTVRFI